jgi:hypothetical protein
VPLLKNTDLKDITEHRAFTVDDRPGTFQKGAPAKRLITRCSRQRCSRRWRVVRSSARVSGVGGKNGTLFPHYATITSPVEAASDHAAIYADLSL